MKKALNRALIAIHAAMHSLLRKRKYTNDRKNILIVFQQLFGDAIVIQNSLKEYAALFPECNGYNICFLARPSVAVFMKANLDIPDEIKVEAVDFKRFLEDYGYFREVMEKYGRTAGTLIVPGTSLSAEIFASASDAPRKIGLVRSIPVNKPLVMAVFSRIAYTETVVPDQELMMLQRHRLLLNYLGAKAYKARLPELLPKERAVSDSNYCVLCPGSSKMEKCWPTERFVHVIDYIVEKYDLPVHLCGGADEIEFEGRILSQVRNPDRVISHIGKTTFSEWSAIVQHADLVLGNDSATMHLAAASRRNAICIAGVYDKFQFFPYRVDALAAGDILPVALIKEVPCQWCRTIGYHAGSGNPECANRIQNGQCAVCIDMITIEEVRKNIDLLMHDK